MTVYGIDRAAFNQGINAKYDFVISEEVSMTLVSMGPNAVGIINDISEDSRSIMLGRLQGAEPTVCASGQINPRRARRERENVAEAEFWDGTQTCSAITRKFSDQRMPDKDQLSCIVETTGTLCANEYNNITHQGVSAGFYPCVGTETESIVRRLTPLECTRLQGFPDGWVTELPDKTDMTDAEVEEWNGIRETAAKVKGGKYKPMTKDKLIKWYNNMIHADSHQYQALGNSIATGPNSFWKFLIKRISAQYDRDITMGSLFDGIGGFPLVHEQINGKGSCRWASEIEEFCIAVTKYHSGDE